MQQFVPHFLLIIIFTSGIDLVNCEKSMFRKNLGAELEAIDQALDNLNRHLRNTINEIVGNEFGSSILNAVQEDLNTCFYPVAEDLEELHEKYLECCEKFNPVYSEYLNIVTSMKDKKKKSNFTAVANQWEGKVLMAFKINVSITDVKKNLNQLANKNTSVFFAILDGVRAGRSVEENLITWKGVKSVAIETYALIVKRIADAKCPETNGFISDLKKALRI
ncbi:uncharacterized protein LOC116337113 [Contarinia nasturtii]|uniref:uncharacterized protein LOC116337113 n=1 Tax=Contarinia nasturtii TaxID=265458 RepID=UPI0012D3AFD1|nr:uncharacterized protein LOC116337113 [Contarinia nasturtii]